MSKKTSNAGLAEIAEILKTRNRFVVMSHARPDGDALGCTLAMALCLRQLGKDVTAWNEDGVPAKFHYLPEHTLVTQPPAEPQRFDVALVLDNAVKSRAGKAIAAVAHADVVINLDTTTPEERLARVLELTGGLGADVVIEAAGSALAFEEGVRLARNGGAYVIAGHYTNVGDSRINVHEHINRKHLDIRGCWGSEVGHFLRALRVLERYQHEVPWHLIGARTFGLGQINEALAIAESLVIPKALVDPWA